MCNDDISKLAQVLAKSYSQQTELYRKLDSCVQTMYSRLVLSRGDLPRVMNLLEEKQRLIEAISAERNRIKTDADKWQQMKATAPVCAETELLNKVLSETENAIRSFLDVEQQLESYLKHLVEKESGTQA